MTKYFIYCRKSSEDEERQILSIEAQLTELREFAKQNNLFVVKEYYESKTAKEPGREVFNFMMSEIEKGNALHRQFARKHFAGNTAKNTQGRAFGKSPARIF